MAQDIVELGVIVSDNDSAVKVTKSLKTLAEQGGKTEEALSKLGKKGGDAGAGISIAASSAGQAARDIGRIDSASSAAASGLSNVAREAAKAQRQFDYNALSAKQYTAALRGVPAQLTDIFVSLQGGQAPLTVLLQQGGQLKDMFGGVGNATRALGGYLMSLVNPFTVAAAAVTGLGAAYYAGWKEGDNLNKSMISTGNILGATRAQLMGYGDAVGNLTGSYGKARDAAQAMAAAGVTFGGDIQATMQSIVEISRLTGREVENVTEDFIRLSKDPVKGIKDLNNQYHFLTDATYAQIKSLVEQGRAQDAATLAVKTYSDTVNGRTAEVTKNLGYIERGWLAIKGAASSAWDSIKGIGRADTLQELQATYDAITKRVETAQNIRTVQNIGRLRQLLEQQAVAKKALDAANAELKKEQDAAANQQKEDEKIKEREEADKRYAELKNSLLRDEIALRATYNQQIKDINAAEAAGNFTASEAARMRKQAADDLSSALNKGNKSIKEQDEFTAQLSQSYADLTKQIMALNAPQETQIQIIERLMGTMPLLTQSYRDWAQAQFDIAKDNEFEASLYRQQTALDDQVEAIRQQALAVKDETATLGMLPSQITKVTIARLEDRKAILQGLGLVVPEIEAQIAAYKELAEAQGGKEFRQAQIDAEKERVKAAEDAAKEIQRTHERMSENINRSLTDALLRGFESGKSFAENFKDTLINMFKSLVLQPVVRLLVDASGISALGTGLVSMLSGGAANAAGAGGSVGEAANLLGVGKNLYSAFTGGLDKLGSSITGSIQDLGVFLSSGNGGLADSIGGFLGQYSNPIATGLAFAPAVISLLKGDVKSAAFSGAGSALGSLLGPGGAVIGGAIGSLLGGAFGFGKKKPKRYGTSASMVYEDGAVISSSTGNIGRALGLDAGLSGLNEAFSASLGGLLSAFGLSDRISSTSNMTARTNVRGDFSAAFDGGSVYYGNKFGKTKKTDISQAFQQMVNDVMGTVLVEAIQKSSLPEGIRQLFTGFSDKDQIQSLIASASQLARYQDDLTNQYNLTADSAAKVAKASGLAGQELIDFTNKIISTTLSLRTPGEALLDAKSILQDQLDSILGNVAVPETIKAFDAILKGIDTTNAEGVAQFSALFQIRDAMAEYTSSLTGLKDGVSEAVFSLKTPEQQLIILQNNLKDAFSELGLAVPKTVAELLALGESIDYTTEEGINLAAVFPALVEGFLNTNEAAVSLASSLGLLDINKFKTLVDYTRAQRYAITGNLDKLPSFDVGTNIVPRDMTANIHAGERIIPAADNKELMQRLESPVTADNSGIEQRLSTLEKVMTAVAKASVSMERRFRKWDGDGMPPERLVTA